MSLFKIAWRSLTQRSLSSALTAVSMAVGVALVVAVLVVHAIINDSFRRTAQGYQLVVGAKGGRLELVLNTVFHLSKPIENIPWSFYEEFSDPNGEFFPDVDLVIPFCLGDNYEGYRVVGTTAAMFDKLEWARGKKYDFREGRNFKDSAPFEAVVGAVVARKTGLAIGDTFQPTHGITTEAEDGHSHDEQFEVVGILAPTGTANDRALFVNVEGFFALEGHAKEPAHGAPAHDHGPADEKHDHPHDPPVEKKTSVKTAAARLRVAPAAFHADEKPAAHAPAHDHDHGHDHAHDHGHDHGHHHDHFVPLPKEQREVTSLLVRCSDDRLASSLHYTINKGRVAQAVYPGQEVSLLMEGLIGNLRFILLVMAVLIVVVAAIGVMVAMYNSMNDRRREISIMRALGASRGTVMAVVLLEAVLLSLLGSVLGLLIGHGLLGLLGPFIAQQTGVLVSPFDMNLLGEALLVPALAALAALAGFVPALAAYRTDVAKSLSAAP